MTNSMFLAAGLSALELRLRFKNRARSRRRASNHRLQVAAEISLLENRCLMSTNVTGGGQAHHDVKSKGKGKGANDDMFTAFGYQWYTNYHFNKPTGYFDQEQWAPQNAFEQNGHIHLKLEEATVGGKYRNFSSGEAEIVSTASGAPANLGYGTYLVAAKTNESFNRLASNNGAAFGAFTYENLRDDGQVDTNTGSGLVYSDKVVGLPQNIVDVLKKGYTVTAHNDHGRYLSEWDDDHQHFRRHRHPEQRRSRSSDKRPNLGRLHALLWGQHPGQLTP